MSVRIYVLCDSREPDDVKRIRYVGRTTTSLDQRLKAHRYDAFHGGRTHRACWIRSVHAAGVKIVIEELAIVPDMWADAAEIDLIAKHRKLGCKLTNHTDGGGGLLNPTAETRSRIGESKRGNRFWVGKHHTPESRAKMAAARIGKQNPRIREVTARPEVRAKIAATLTGRKQAPRSAEWRAAISRAGKGRKFSPEHCARIGASKRTPESIARMRALGLAQRGRKMSEAFRNACAERWRGRKHTEETKAKMSAWQRGGSSHRAKLTWDQVRMIRRSLCSWWNLTASISARVSCSAQDD